MEFRILGALEVVEDGRALQVGGPRQRAVLGILALHANEVVSRDRLIDELWGESPPETAQTALQVYVSQLRKALGADRIETRTPGYRLRIEPDELDLDRFELLVTEARRAPAADAGERLRLALEIWRGPPLADLDDALARPERARLEEERMSAHELRIAVDMDLGRHEVLVPELEGLVRAHPLRERLRAQLMLALYRSGRQADALDVYRQGRRLLDEQLGIEPGKELRELEKAILTQDPALAAPPPSLPERLLEVAGRRRRALVVVGAVVLTTAVAGASIRLATSQGGSSVTVLPNSVAVVDMKARVVADVPVGSGPVAVATGGGAVWVANGDDGTVSRIDSEERRVVATIGVGGEVSDLAVGSGAIWVAGGNDETLTRIDPRLNAVEARLTFGRADPLHPRPIFAVATGADAVWATRGNHVLRIDPDTNEVTLDISIDQPRSLVVGAGAVWITTASERILRVEPSTGAVTGRIPVPEQAYAPVANRGRLWSVVAIGSGQIWRFDADTGSPSGTIGIGRVPVDLALSGSTLWVATVIDHSVSRIDAATGRVDAIVSVGLRPTAVASGEGAVWVAVGARATP